MTKPPRDAKGNQKGQQDHAEGEHGAKTRAKIKEQLHAGAREVPLDEKLDADRKRAGFEGKRRLVEDREQHDEAEKNSEKERLHEVVDRGENDGPSDNRGALHGVTGSRSHRADFQERTPEGRKKSEG